MQTLPDTAAVCDARPKELRINRQVRMYKLFKKSDSPWMINHPGAVSAKIFSFMLTVMIRFPVSTGLPV